MLASVDFPFFCQYNKYTLLVTSGNLPHCQSFIQNVEMLTVKSRLLLHIQIQGFLAHKSRTTVAIRSIK